MKYSVIVMNLVVLAVQLFRSGPAAASGFELSNEQMVRLGVELQPPGPVDTMTIATGPAEIVIPPAGLVVASAPLAGMLARLYVAEGEAVAAGEVFAELESAELLDWQRAFLDASIEAELASLQLARDAALVADGIIAERRLEESRARDRAAAASLEQSRRRLAMAGFSDREIADLADGGVLTSRIDLRAPIDGVVTARYADPGSRVDTLDPIASFADLSEVWVEMHLGAERAIAVEPGMHIALPSGEGTVTATITLVGAVIDPETQTVLVRGTLRNPTRRLRAGQFFTAEIFAASASSPGYSLPAAALVRSGDEAYVFVRHSSGFEAVRVEPVHEDERRVLISDGLEAGMQIAVRGTSTLKSIWMASEAGESP